MGALPKEKAGVGSAMNDVLRELGGTLGVAVLGTLLANKYADGDGRIASPGVPDPVANAYARQRGRCSRRGGSGRW